MTKDKTVERVVASKLDFDSTRGTADIDYRLVRQVTLNLWDKKDLDRETVCDAQPMLKRNAVECGNKTGEKCPICCENELSNVTYVFGPRLPSHGRCISTEGELSRLSQRKSQLVAYVIEVCSLCGWNHLIRSLSLGCN